MLVKTLQECANNYQGQKQELEVHIVDRDNGVIRETIDFFKRPLESQSHPLPKYEGLSKSLLVDFNCSHFNSSGAAPLSPNLFKDQRKLAFAFSLNFPEN